MKYLICIVALGLFSLALLSSPAGAGEPAGSKVSSSKAPKKQPDDYRLYLKSGHRSKEWDELIEPGFQSFDGGNYATAYVFLRRAYDRGCRDGLVLFRLGLYKESQRQYKDAADILAQAAEKMPKQYPGHPIAKSIHEHAGRVLYQADDYDRALPELQKALETSPDNFMVLFMAGQIFRLKKQHAEAKRLFEKALNVPPPEGVTPNPRVKLLAELMMLAYEQKDLDASLAYADQILAIAPGDPAALSYKQKIEHEKLKRKEMEMIERLVK